MNSISPNLNVMIKACEKASKVIIRDFGEIENLQVSKKGPRDFVTKTDKKVEKILVEELSKAKKNFSFITEESGKIKNLLSQKIVVFTDFKNDKEIDKKMLKLGLQTELRDKINKLKCFSYNLKNYNNKRSWNNPEGWANPENFDKFRW